jgi:hypothetical protein
MLDTDGFVSPFWTDQDVAGLLGISVKHLRNKICKGDPLPPYILLPKSRSRLWLKAEVTSYLTSLARQGELVRRGEHCST